MNLCDIVVTEIVIASGVDVVRITERAPQLGGDCLVVDFNDFCTDVIALGDKGSISQEAHTAGKVKENE